MKSDIRNLWVTALTSGEYEQGIGALRDDNKYCCLGVLCELYRKETGKGRWVTTKDGQTFIDNSGFRSSGFLTNDVRQWAGLLTIHPDVNGQWLHKMNDTGITFATIAELISREL